MALSISYSRKEYYENLINFLKRGPRKLLFFSDWTGIKWFLRRCIVFIRPVTIAFLGIMYTMECIRRILQLLFVIKYACSVVLCTLNWPQLCLKPFDAKINLLMKLFKHHFTASVLPTLLLNGTYVVLF